MKKLRKDHNQLMTPARVKEILSKYGFVPGAFWYVMKRRYNRTVYYASMGTIAHTLPDYYGVSIWPSHETTSGETLKNEDGESVMFTADRLVELLEYHFNKPIAHPAESFAQEEIDRYLDRI